uniref:Uncharacterized protein n=1 Tax=uncultured bacterium 5G4 TaxID=1701326 RepID=A0A166H2Y8_9BACT|nr:hypothetical protein 5G4_015 [uncultured bacterium 5G4]
MLTPKSCPVEVLVLGGRSEGTTRLASPLSKFRMFVMRQAGTLNSHRLRVRQRSLWSRSEPRVEGTGSDVQAVQGCCLF